MICPNCNYNSCFLGEGSIWTFRGWRKYCLNCGQDLQKPVQALAGSDLSGTRFEVDNATGELLVKKRALFGSPKVHKRIPLSEIEEVKLHSITFSTQYGTSTDYYCDLLIGGVWKTLTKGTNNAQSALRVAAAIGRRVENPKEKPRELVNHLYEIFRVSMTTDREQRFGLEQPLQLTHGVDLTTIKAGGWSVTGNIKRLVVEGIISLQDPDVDSVAVLHTSRPDHYYVLGYIVAGKTVESVRTYRKKKFRVFGRLANIEWRGGPLSDHLNSDDPLRELLLSDLKTSNCDVYVTSDQTSNAVIIFGICYPRQWVRLPESLFPSETRVKAVKMIANKVRRFSG